MKKAISEYQNYIIYRIHFEKLRLGLNVAIHWLYLLASVFAIPAFAS